jgi:hypothetical protein
LSLKNSSLPFRPFACPDGVRTRKKQSMIDLWYYWHEAAILGPFSGKQLVALASAGDILPDDIVWREGVEGGVSANKVQHLFVTPLLSTPSVTAAPSEVSPVAGTSQVSERKPGDATAAPAVSVAVEPPKSTWDRGRATSGGKARAVAGKGTIIVGQDGVTVKFRMKCTVCGYEDSSWKNMTISRGTTRHPFYCPKCRKRCQVEIHGHVG